jgi:uncharacterized protein
MINSMNLEARLEKYAISIFRCDPQSVHGIQHWKNVYENGMLICKHTDADPVVATCFAYLHDSCRIDDGGDLEHGPRAADMLAGLRDDLLADLNGGQVELLEYAIRFHTDGRTHTDPTIGCCWDSDRLDLGRVGIIPEELLMSTDVGREICRCGSRKLYG